MKGIILNNKFNDLLQKMNIKNMKSYDLSIRQEFSEKQTNSFGVPKASAHPFKIDNFVGDTNQGGSCNFDEIKIIPHCNGTHTECIGHILNSRDTILDLLDDVFVPALLITCEPISFEKNTDSYIPRLDKGDILITKAELEKQIGDFSLNNYLQDKALIIRTNPNNESKKYQDYNTIPSPFFTNDAMKYIYELGIKHLLVDLPSIDKAYDDGMLSNHRIYWDVELGVKEKAYSKTHQKTITEFIYVADEISDGEYLLNIQIAPFNLDASPSRPIIFYLEK